MDMREYYQTVEDRVIAEFAQADGFEHRGLKGAQREDSIRGVLRQGLPSSVGVTNGEIAGVGGARSGQIDAILYDATVGAMLYRHDETNVLPPESVLAIVSVKTTLERAHLFELAEIGRFLRDFDRFPRFLAQQAGADNPPAMEWPPSADAPPGIFVVARDGPPLASIVEALQQIEEDAREDAFPHDRRLNGIAVFSRGYVGYEADTPAGATHFVPFVRPMPTLRFRAVDSPRDALGLLVMSLYSYTAFQPKVRPNMTRHFRMTDAPGFTQPLRSREPGTAQH
jgi:hypothetical protein